jgi:hypothetical protein
LTPSERLVMLALAVSCQCSSTIANIRELTGGTREHTCNVLRQLVTRGIVTQVSHNFGTRDALDAYTIVPQPSNEPINMRPRKGDPTVPQLLSPPSPSITDDMAKAEIKERVAA